ncbi:hypothetical protein CFAM422_009173 [Trichoderma lentiforme]|uniref:Uncharacterized protein n=1 Tax=Trichoderma lentiforme TaxID=1567552 RepID=A0A9P4X809_9HYPO|nr:hypothetical protein CFAM422_009173 [Trichoderma lentiforme]
MGFADGESPRFAQYMAESEESVLRLLLCFFVNFIICADELAYGTGESYELVAEVLSISISIVVGCSPRSRAGSQPGVTGIVTREPGTIGNDKQQNATGTSGEQAKAKGEMAWE